MFVRERGSSAAKLARGACNLNCQAASPVFHRKEEEGERKDLYDHEIITAEIASSCLASSHSAWWRIPQKILFLSLFLSALAHWDLQIVAIVLDSQPFYSSSIRISCNKSFAKLLHDTGISELSYLACRASRSIFYENREWLIFPGNPLSKNIP